MSEKKDEPQAPEKALGDKPAMEADAFDAVIEIASGGAPVKYEMEKGTGTLVVDRFLFTPMRYPCSYGFVPRTLSRDGDPCDVLVVTPTEVMPGVKLRVRAIGVLLMEDESGPDEKILSVPISRLTANYDAIAAWSDLPPNTTRQIEHFLLTTRISSPGNGAGSSDGAGRTRRRLSSTRRNCAGARDRERTLPPARSLTSERCHQAWIACCTPIRTRARRESAPMPMPAPSETTSSLPTCARKPVSTRFVRSPTCRSSCRT